MSHRLVTSAATVTGISVTLALGVLGDVATSVAEPSPSPAPAATEVVELVDVPDEFDAMVDWAVERFDDAGLDLPPLRVVHHGDDRTECRGRVGRHVRTGDASTVHLCTERGGRRSQTMVLHEIAHAWVEHRVDDERRAEFRELRGYTHWRDYERAEWHENGTEQAAEIMVWGLVDRPMNMHRIEDNSCVDLVAGFVLLTGRLPLPGSTERC